MSNGLINRASEYPLLNQGLALIIMDVNVQPPQYSELYVTKRSEKAAETHVEMQALPAAATKPEGTPVAASVMQSLYTTVSRMVTIGVSFIMTMESIEDNQYKDKFPLGSINIKNALLGSKNLFAANNFNLGWDPLQPIGDGQPFFSTAHPLGNGAVQSNTFAAPMSLNETTLESAQTLVKTARAASGLILGNLPKKLLVNPALGYTATRLLSSKYEPGTANNAINPTNAQNLISGGHLENYYLTNELNWFITTTNEGLIHYIRSDVKTNVSTDPSTSNLICQATERFSFAVVNFRSAVGAQGV